MLNKISYPSISLTMIVMMVSLLLAAHGASTQQAWGSSQVSSPLPTPVVSDYAQVAIKYLSQKYGIPEDRLVAEYEVKTPTPLAAVRILLVQTTQLRIT